MTMRATMLDLTHVLDAGEAGALRAGESVVFADARMLDGREAFAASLAGDRLRWKGGFDTVGAS